MKAAQNKNINFPFKTATTTTTTNQCFKSNIPANPVENFMPDLNVFAGQQNIFSYTPNQCNTILEIFIKPLANL